MNKPTVGRVSMKITSEQTEELAPTAEISSALREQVERDLTPEVRKLQSDIIKSVFLAMQKYAPQHIQHIHGVTNSPAQTIKHMAEVIDSQALVIMDAVLANNAQRDENDKLKGQVCQLLTALEAAHEALDSTQGNINPERGYADELELEISSAAHNAHAAILSVRSTL